MEGLGVGEGEGVDEDVKSSELLGGGFEGAVEVFIFADIAGGEELGVEFFDGLDDAAGDFFGGEMGEGQLAPFRVELFGDVIADGVFVEDAEDEGFYRRVGA